LRQDTSKPRADAPDRRVEQSTRCRVSVFLVPVSCVAEMPAQFDVKSVGYLSRL